MEIHVPMDGVIDIEAEKTRLSKERDRAAAEVDRLRQKLTNATFTERAPADVVAAERAKLEAAEDTLNKTDGQIERLGGLP
jgi:valyl-tRNA synthetase